MGAAPHGAQTAPGRRTSNRLAMPQSSASSVVSGETLKSYLSHTRSSKAKVTPMRPQQEATTIPFKTSTTIKRKRGPENTMRSKSMKPSTEGITAYVYKNEKAHHPLGQFVITQSSRSSGTIMYNNSIHNVYYVNGRWVIQSNATTFKHRKQRRINRKTRRNRKN
jgi:hypothetical protein